MEKFPEYLKGRGAQINTPNPFKQNNYDTETEDGLDEGMNPYPQTQFFYEHPKKIINKVKSPDIPADYSMNPYQGCEHGCIYCYARNTHEYWGYSAGLDFESKIIIKSNAAELLKKELNHPKWKPSPIMFSGNTDCYQPVERKEQITRKCLEVFRSFNHPLGLITKNSMILRDLDILKDLARDRLVHVYVTITTLDENLRRAMEPRTVSAQKRLDIIRTLTEEGIPAGAMLGPIIPGLNNYEIPGLVEQVAQAGALAVGYTFIRLNGAISIIFENWLRTQFPDRADKVLNQIRGSHDGKLNDSQYGRRMRGEGPIADSVSSLFKIAKRKHLGARIMPPYNLDAYRRPGDGQLSLF